jgi:diguanylate cyclase
MTLHDPSLTRFSDIPSNPISALFKGRGRKDPGQGTAQRELRAIGEFMATYHLPVTALTLTVAHDCTAGTNPLLMRRIEQRVADGEPVTEQWLDEATALIMEEGSMGQLAIVLDRLEESLSEFGRTTQAARTATRDYNCALAEHGRELERHGSDQGKVVELVQLVRVMIDRTREIERDMARSEEHSKNMREDLERAQKVAEEDYLTGLPNRRSFDKLLERERGLAKVHGECLCIGFCDIDHFKRVNDVHGHQAGDRVIRAVARKLGKIADTRCFVARHGGEEFAVVFRGLTLDEAMHRLDQARQELEQSNFINRDTNVPIGMVTFSAGLAAFPHDAEPAEVLRTADAALYAAKNGGRNQVVLGGGQ